MRKSLRSFTFLATACLVASPALAADPPAASSAPPAPAKDAERPPLLPAATPAPQAPPAPAGVTISVPSGERPTTAGQIGAQPSEVYAEDWWSHARPAVEIHGYYRLRWEMFYNFALGRADNPSDALWAQPPDHNFVDSNGNSHEITKCGDGPTTPAPCGSKTQSGANMRLRLNPEIHVSDNLRVMTQIDLLDNVVLGSTPEGTYSQPSSAGFEAVAHGGYVSRAAFTPSQVTPTSGINSYSNSIAVKRAWAEYMTPVGQLRFGRMPSQWGLGILANSGDGYDSDYQSTSDRLMFLTGVKSLDLYFGAAVDFVNEGPTSATVASLAGGQPYDISQRDDVNQYVLVLVRRKNPELQKLALARGELVLNGGMYFVYRSQDLAIDGDGGANGPRLGASSSDVQSSYVRRYAKAYIPDAWVQLLYKKFRFESELVTVQGSMENTATSGSDYNKDNGGDWKIRQWGLATQTELKAAEDRLRLNFGFGWSSGDPDLKTNSGGQSLAPPSYGLQPQVTRDHTFSEFRFHPDYRVDLILHRNILSRVQGTYYFRPSVDYDFSRNPNGQRLGGGAALIWTRASEFVQTFGHKRDLGIEMDLSLYFQSKDGALNDNPDKMGGFFTMLQYGVLFPMGGFDYLPEQKAHATVSLDTSAAQILRWYMGVLF